MDVLVKSSGGATWGLVLSPIICINEREWAAVARLLVPPGAWHIDEEALCDRARQSDTHRVGVTLSYARSRGRDIDGVVVVAAVEGELPGDEIAFWVSLLDIDNDCRTWLDEGG